MIGPRQRTRILERDGFACRRCGKQPPETLLHVDHIVARSRGGTDDDSNLQALCRECNIGKADGPAHEGDLRHYGASPGKRDEPPVGWFTLGKPGLAPTGDDLGWQGQIVARVGENYLVQRWSWVDGYETDALLVPVAAVSQWLFFRDPEAWRQYVRDHLQLNLRCRAG